MTKNFLLHINSITSFLLYLLPLSLVSGPALPDIIISTASLLFIFKIIIEKNYKLLNYNLVIIFFIWCLYLFSTSLFSNDYLFSFESSLFFFRFGFFSLLIVYLINNNIKFLKIFTVCLCLTFLLVSIDALFQFIVGYNFLAFTMPEDLSGMGRISGLFGQDLILGSFLSRLFPLLIGLLIFNFYLVKKFNLFLILFVVTINVVIFISGERTAFFYCFLSNLLFIILSKKYNFQFFISIILSTIIILILVNFNNPLKFRMYDYTKDQFNDEVLNIPSDKENKKIPKTYISTNINESFFYKLKFISNEHEVLFSKALIIFNYNKFFGIGPKMFRIECSNPRYKVAINFDNDSGHDINTHGCSSHPHNIYLQLLSETGILGTLPVIFLFIYIIYSLLVVGITKIRSIEENKVNQIDIFIYISMLISLWPFIPTGSFFNNWLSIINFLCFGLFLFIKKSFKNKNY